MASLSILNMIDLREKSHSSLMTSVSEFISNSNRISPKSKEKMSEKMIE